MIEAVFATTLLKQLSTTTLLKQLSTTTLLKQLCLLPTVIEATDQTCHLIQSQYTDRLFDLVVKASAARAEDPEFDSRLHRGDVFGSSDASHLKTGTPVAVLPGAWR